MFYLLIKTITLAGQMKLTGKPDFKDCLILYLFPQLVRHVLGQRSLCEAKNEHRCYRCGDEPTAVNSLAADPAVDVGFHPVR
jgi:hypothetical protein